MEQIENTTESQKSHKELEGNTKTSSSTHNGNQCRIWMITLKDDEDMTPSQLSQELKVFCDKFVFQKEKGNTTGYLHWQICIRLKVKERFSTVKNYFPHGAHIEQARNGFKSFNYCSKEDTRIEGPYDENSSFVPIIPLTQDWQINLKNELLENPPDYRKIIFIVDYVGGKGKSSFAKHMYMIKKAQYFNNAKSADISFCLDEKGPNILIFDLCRSSQDHINYEVIENVKNGLLFSGKYESKVKCFNTPHIVVMMNESPNKDKLSKDRYDIREI